MGWMFDNAGRLIAETNAFAGVTANLFAVRFAQAHRPADARRDALLHGGEAHARARLQL
jgi:hypothetical protein